MISYFPDLPPCNMTELCFFKKYPVRRALLQFGPNDSMKVAESLLTISAEHFLKKWNFDPIMMKPTPGRFIWTPIVAKSDSNNGQLSEAKPTTVGTVRGKPTESATSKAPPPCPRIPQPRHAADRSPDAPSETEIKLSNHCSASDLSPPSPPQVSLRLSPQSKERVVKPLTNRTSKTPRRPTRPADQVSATSRCRQSKITEFGRQRKRLYSSTGPDDEMIETSPSKKLSLDTPSKSLPSVTAVTE